MDKPTEQEKQQSLRENPGAAVDAGDKEHVGKCAVEQDVRQLNNNPRSHDNEMP